MDVLSRILFGNVLWHSRWEESTHLRDISRAIDLVPAAYSSAEDEGASSENSHAEGVKNSKTSEEAVSDERPLTETEAGLFSPLRAPSDERLPPTSSGRGFRAASYQWHYPDQASCCELFEFRFMGLYRQKWWHGANGFVDCAIAEVVRKVQIQGAAGEDLRVVLAQNVTLGSTKEWNGIAEAQRDACFQKGAFTTRLVTELRRLSAEYELLGPPTRQLLLLRIHHAHLNLFASFLSVYHDQYLFPRIKGIFRIINLKLFQSSLKALTRDASRTQLIAVLGKELIATTESLLEVVTATNLLMESQERDNRLAVIAAEISGCARETKVSLENMSTEFSQGLQYASIYRDLHQSSNVRMLTLLATFFLPMSLAAGVLSMQTRFRDLRTLLYDFFGVSIFAVVFALILVVLARVYSWATRQYRKLQHSTNARPGTRSFRMLLATSSIMMTYFVLVSGGVIAAFAVGMFYDVFLGGLLLAGCAFTMVIYVLCAMGTGIIAAKLRSTASGRRSSHLDAHGQARNEIAMAVAHNSEGDGETRGLDKQSTTTEFHGPIQGNPGIVQITREDV